MSVSNGSTSGSRRIGEPEYDVKIIGGKRHIQLKNNRNDNVDRSLPKEPSQDTSSRFNSGKLVLPPIGSPGNQNHTPENADPDAMLRRDVHEHLQNYDENRLRALLEELQDRDLQDRGLANPKNLSVLANKHKLPLPPPIMAALYLRFSSYEVPGTINYEHLLDFLLYAKNTPIQSSHGGREDQKRELPDDSSAKRKKPMRNPFPEREEMRLIAELERELADDNPNLDLFRRRAIELDKERRGVLSRPQIEELLRIAGITISDNLLTKLFIHNDKQGYGLTDFTAFLECLERAKPQNEFLFRPSERKIIRARTPPIPLGPLPHSSGFSPPMTGKPSRPPINATPTLPRLTETPLDDDEWMRRFEKMAVALHNSLQERPGYLPPDDIRHIVDTYNVVYNLQLDLSKTNEALQMGHRGVFEQVDLDVFVQQLLASHRRTR